MNDLITKHFGKKDIRIIDKDGNPWFVAKDVFENLNVLWQGNRSLKNIPSEWKGVVSYTTPGGKQSIVILNQSGVFFVAARANNSEWATNFQKWVFGEVLPEIFKEGEYRKKKSAERQKSKVIRNAFTATLSEHGYKAPIEYIKTTNSMKKKLGIKANKKKDDLDLIELCKVQAAENLATINILQSNATGYIEVKPFCDSSALMVQIATKKKEVTA